MRKRQGRRGNNEGTITQRTDGRWEARITLPDGKRRCFYGKTRKEVASRLAEARRDLDKGLPVVDEKQTFSQYVDAWLDSAKHTIRPSTWRRYRDLIRIHAVPTLGGLPLSKVTAQQVQALYAKKLDEGLSPTTVHHLHAVLHRAFDEALQLGLVIRNVTEMIKPPRIQHHEMATLSPDQARTFLEAVKGDWFEALYVLALSTGMRQGELLALHWREVDLDRSTLQVRGTLHYHEGQYHITEPKTARSRRRIALSKTAVEALRRQRVQLNTARLALGPLWEEQDLVFPNRLGKPMDNTNLLRQEFRPLLKRAGLPEIRFHDLRHTAATLLLGRSINPKVVSEMLGHSQVSITLDLYSHVTPDMQQVAADAMDDALGG